MIVWQRVKQQMIGNSCVRICERKEENIVGQGENAGSPFPTMLLKGFFQPIIIIWDCLVADKTNDEKKLLT